MRARLFLICFVSLFVVQAALSQAVSSPRRSKSEQNCTNHLEIVDKCSSQATYSYTMSSNPHPINANELRASCDRINEGYKCLRVYGKCFASFARRTVSAYVTSRSKHSKRICANMNDPKTIEFYKSNECIKSSNRMPRMISSERELISTLELAATNKTLTWDDRFHHACCSAVNYKARQAINLGPDCSKYKEIQEEFIESMIGELLDTACPDSKRLAVICAKLPKLTFAKDWKVISLTRAALELVVALSENENKDKTQT